MVEAARAKAATWDGPGPAPAFVVGDVLALPYEDQSFDCVTISFGIRNVADIPRALSEIRRVLRPGGRFVCLELTPVQSALIRMPLQFYLYKCAPLLGRLLSGDRAAYEYLPHSVARFPNAETLARMFQAAGLRNVRYRLLNFGSIAIHRGVR
jgi:demethylmenaquinone methyltransferase/2-methoxy-6-polyprenyl-1,4-benzoquinol methylase